MRTSSSSSSTDASSSRAPTTNCWPNAASIRLSMETGPRKWPNTGMALDKETEERIEQPVSEEAERETRLTPTEAVAQMRINVPVRGNRKLRKLLERVNEDTQLKGWWHASNVNAVARMQINDHSWVHIDRKSTRLNSSHSQISYAVFCLKKKKQYV